MSEPVTLQRIERALAVVARVIRENPNGEQAWPIFERLEMERERMMGRDGRLDEAISRDRSQGTKTISSHSLPQH